MWMAVQDRETDRQRKRGRVGWNKGGVNVVKLVLSGAVWPDGEIKSIIPNMEKWKISNDFFSRIAIFTIAQKLPYIFLPSIFVAEIYLAQSGYTVIRKSCFCSTFITDVKSLQNYSLFFF